MPIILATASALLMDFGSLLDINIFIVNDVVRVLKFIEIFFETKFEVV